MVESAALDHEFEGNEGRGFAWRPAPAARRPLSRLGWSPSLPAASASRARSASERSRARGPFPAAPLPAVQRLRRPNREQRRVARPGRPRRSTRSLAAQTRRARRGARPPLDLLDIERDEACPAGRKQFELALDNQRETGRRPRRTGSVSLSPTTRSELQVQRLRLDPPLHLQAWAHVPRPERRTAATADCRRVGDRSTPGVGFLLIRLGGAYPEIVRRHQDRAQAPLDHGDRVKPAAQFVAIQLGEQLAERDPCSVP